MTAHNTTLQAVRRTLLFSQDGFAEALRAAGERAGQPNTASKRLVQRWESGVITQPHPMYARALQMVTGLPIEQLGFPAGADRLLVADGRGGHDLEVRQPPAVEEPARQPAGHYTGIWRSRYEYFSSGRRAAYEGLHMALLLQQGSALSVQSLKGSSRSAMSMSLDIDGAVVTGSWVERTNPDGYYLGARYHGAIQLLVDPTGRRMSGKWVGFGKDGDINTGPWALTFVEASISRAAIQAWSRPVD